MIRWIESLLITRLEDHRKYVLWLILAPYLINLKKLSYDEAFRVIRDWLNKCDKITPMNFNPTTLHNHNKQKCSGPRVFSTEWKRN